MTDVLDLMRAANPVPNSARQPRECTVLCQTCLKTRTMNTNAICYRCKEKNATSSRPPCSSALRDRPALDGRTGPEFLGDVPLGDDGTDIASVRRSSPTFASSTAHGELRAGAREEPQKGPGICTIEATPDR